MKKFSIALVSMLFPALILAQNSVSGTVTDATSGQALAGANVVLEGTSLGAAADADGSYTITEFQTELTLLQQASLVMRNQAKALILTQMQRLTFL